MIEITDFMNNIFSLIFMITMVTVIVGIVFSVSYKYTHRNDDVKNYLRNRDKSVSLDLSHLSEKESNEIQNLLEDKQ